MSAGNDSLFDKWGILLIYDFNIEYIYIRVCVYIYWGSNLHNVPYGPCYAARNSKQRALQPILLDNSFAFEK